MIRVWSCVTADEGFLRRTIDYASFMVGATLAALFVPKPAIVVATSSQFFTACAGQRRGAFAPDAVPFLG